MRLPRDLYIAAQNMGASKVYTQGEGAVAVFNSPETAHDFAKRVNQHIDVNLGTEHFDTEGFKVNVLPLAARTIDMSAEHIMTGA